LRSLAQRILDYNYEKSRKKFPFTRPYQELYSRCLAVFAVLDKELTHGNLTGKTRNFLIKLHCILWPVTSSESFRTVSKNLQEKADIFDQFREAMRLDSEGGYISKAGETDTDATALAEMEDDIGKLIAEFQGTLAIMGDNAKIAADIILSHMEEHGKYLWGHKITMTKPNGDVVSRFAYRTNNVIETYFRTIKRNVRRRNGCADAGYPMDHVSAAICYVGNLKNKEYLDKVYGGSLDNLPRTFARYDSQNPLSAVTDAGNKPIKGSLPAADKKLVRSTAFVQKVG
jgi:hypothetical protein